MTTLGQMDNQGQVVASTVVNQRELGINCWSPSRFLGGGCDIWHDCKYPEKQTCKATASHPATKKMSTKGRAGSTGLKRVECDSCGMTGALRNMYVYEGYDTPWEEVPRKVYFHKKMPRAFQKYYHYDYYESCEELRDNHGWSDFRWFECCECQRMICEQNPSNGWHVQCRDWGEDGEQICLRCYEKVILEKGIPREKFEVCTQHEFLGSAVVVCNPAKQVPGGMFFSGDNHEAYDAGFTKEDTYFIGSSDSAEKVCAKALELIDSGHKVVIGYESMAIGGLEGTVSLFSKREEHDVNDDQHQ